jgi:glyoxylase-like metal-dependent hydrolase (beta-lactamase superfamily II)
MPLSNQKSPPSADELEVSIFGPGFGECVLIHVGEGAWLIVDSCLDRDAGKPAALAYFDEIGTDPANSVELILATHWHDDHIAGIGQIVEACPQANFWCSDALRCEEFLALLELKLARRDIKFTRGAHFIGRVLDMKGPASTLHLEECGFISAA